MQKVRKALLALPPESRTSEIAAEALIGTVEIATPLDGGTKSVFRELVAELFANFRAEDKTQMMICPPDAGDS